MISYMKSELCLPLQTTQEQFGRLRELQVVFAQVCNALAPVVRQTRVWNRVALHHLMYRQLRAQFPEVGSQMVCNAIYSVSRSCRVIFQHPQSPFHLSRLGERTLPLLRFSDTCPVFFDRHTLSVKDGQVSMFTMDGRMRFALALSAEQTLAFREQKLREISLSQHVPNGYALTFRFDDEASQDRPLAHNDLEIPEYVIVEEQV